MEEFWNVQTKVENQFLQQHKRTRIEKNQGDMDRWRTQICNISFMAEKQFNYLEERKRKIRQKQMKEGIKEGRRVLENRYKLDAMTIDSRRWPKLDDLENSIRTSLVIP